jgi:hypothetical protein
LQQALFTSLQLLHVGMHVLGMHVVQTLVTCGQMGGGCVVELSVIGVIDRSGNGESQPAPHVTEITARTRYERRANRIGRSYRSRRPRSTAPP